MDRRVEPERAEGSGGAFRAEHGRAARRPADLRQQIRVTPLGTIYKDNADTIIGNMDSQVFLGGSEPTTLKELQALQSLTDKIN